MAEAGRNAKDREERDREWRGAGEGKEGEVHMFRGVKGRWSHLEMRLDVAWLEHLVQPFVFLLQVLQHLIHHQPLLRCQAGRARGEGPHLLNDLIRYVSYVTPTLRGGDGVHERDLWEWGGGLGSGEMKGLFCGRGAVGGEYGGSGEKGNMWLKGEDEAEGQVVEGGRDSWEDEKGESWGEGEESTC